MSHFQIGVTFAIVFGVILYRISTKAALAMSSNPMTRSNVRLTVKTTAAIINLIVILILDEVYAAVARWLTVLGQSPSQLSHCHSSARSCEVKLCFHFLLRGSQNRQEL